MCLCTRSSYPYLSFELRRFLEKSQFLRHRHNGPLSLLNTFLSLFKHRDDVALIPVVRWFLGVVPRGGTLGWYLGLTESRCFTSTYLFGYHTSAYKILQYMQHNTRNKKSQNFAIYATQHKEQEVPKCMELKITTWIFI